MLGTEWSRLAASKPSTLQTCWTTTPTVLSAAHSHECWELKFKISGGHQAGESGLKVQQDDTTHQEGCSLWETSLGVFFATKYKRPWTIQILHQGKLE